MKSVEHKSYFVYLLLALVVFIWGLNFSLVKWAVSELSPLPFNVNVVRYTLASFTPIGFLPLIMALLVGTKI